MQVHGFKKGRRLRWTIISRRFLKTSSRCSLARGFGIIASVAWTALLTVNWWSTSHLEARLVQETTTQTSAVISTRKRAVLPNELVARQERQAWPAASEPGNSSSPDTFLWLDAIAKTQFHHHRGGLPSAFLPSDDVSTLGVVYPEQWKDDPLIAWELYTGRQRMLVKVEAKVMQVTWTPGTERMYGIDNKVVPPEEGGQTVHGHWPELLSGLTYIAMVKCGHTKLMNAVGDLRQRLSGAVSVLAKDAHAVTSVLTKAVAEQKNFTMPGGHIIFSLVRDPIDRFISGTCHEMLMGLDNRLTQGCFSNRNPGNHPSGSEMMDCALSRIHDMGKWEYHQEMQVYQLINVASMVQELPVTIIPFDKAIKPLLAEIGGTAEKNRDRQNDHAYKKSPGMTNFCGLKPHDLSLWQLKEVCEILQPMSA